MAGNCAGDEERVRRGVHLEYSEIFYGDAVASHAARHAHAFHDTPARAPAAADGTGRALSVLLSVTARAAVEAVPLDHALEPFALRYCGNLDDIACGEDGNINRLAGLQV